MVQSDNAKSGASRAVVICLVLGLAAGAAVYAVSGSPLPSSLTSFVNRYFYGASGSLPEQAPAQRPAARAPEPGGATISPPSFSPPVAPASPSRSSGAEAPALSPDPAAAPGGRDGTATVQAPDGPPLPGAFTPHSGAERNDAENGQGAAPAASGPQDAPGAQAEPQGNGTENIGVGDADAPGSAKPGGAAPHSSEPGSPAQDGNAGGPNGPNGPRGPGEPLDAPGAASASGGESGQGETSPGVVRYGRGHPVDGRPSVARGRIEQGAPVGPAGDDPVVGGAFVRDLAVFLADNYWPRGAHPLARTGGISTAGLRWANMRYGAGLASFGVNADDPSSARRRLLEYAFTPGMIRALYRLHAERFCAELEEAARARTTENGPLNDGQRAELFAIYGDMAKGLAGCIRAYRRTPGIRALVASYAAASDKASEDFMRYAETMDGPPAARAGAAERYRLSVLEREQHKERLAAVMRRGGDTRGLDADSLVYAALWLHRRGEDRDAAFSAAAEACAACSARLHELAKQYRAVSQ